jgi:hypothetical protein
LLEPGIVNAKAATGSFDHLLPRNLSPVDHQSVVEAELSNELALCPAVSITKWMNGVDLTKAISAPAGEVFEVTPRKMPFVLQFSACLVEARNDVLGKREGIAGFRDTYCPEVSGPLIHILKYVVVDRLNLTCIKPARQWLVFKLAKTAGGGFRFEFA